MPRIPPESPYEREAGYAARYRDERFHSGSGPGTHRRESDAIRALLRDQPEGLWLDMPCGAGRLSSLLPGSTVQVDRDASMVAISGTGDRACARASQLPFRDATFDGCLSMRLFHHVSTPEERQAILAELRRVTDGPLIVSFFEAVNLQNVRRTVRRWFGRRHTGRTAIRWRQFRADLEASGWRPTAWQPLRRFVSEQWLVRAE